MLEQLFTPEMKGYLEEVYEKGHFIRESGFNASFDFRKALEDFYDLEWRSHSEIIGRCPHHYKSLDQKDTNLSKKGKFPTNVFSTLERVTNRSVNEFVINYNELSYEKVRESLESGSLPLSTQLIYDSLNLLGLCGFGTGLSISLFNRNSLPWSVPLTIGSVALIVAVTYKHYNDWNNVEKNIPEDIKKRKKAFNFLYYNAAIEANSINEEFNRYFEKN